MFFSKMSVNQHASKLCSRSQYNDRLAVAVIAMAFTLDNDILFGIWTNVVYILALLHSLES